MPAAVTDAPGSQATDTEAVPQDPPRDQAAREEAPQEPAGARRGIRALIARHRVFSVAIAAAAVLRVMVMLGYWPIMWYNDSYSYVGDAVHASPDFVRPDGYPLMLYVLMPLHSFAVVAALQAMGGLAMGTGIYAVLRRRGLPGWGATLLTLPALFDVFELQIEHMVMADALFAFLVTMVVVVICWSDRLSVPLAAGIGLVTGYAGVVRSVGLPLIAVIAVCLVLRRVGWRAVTALLVAGVTPIAGYMVWFHARDGQYAITESSGVYLLSRVSSFAECSKIKLPPDLRVLCDPRPPSQRSNSQEYLWDGSTPMFGVSNGDPFTPKWNSLTGQFAERAILAQPADYIRVVAMDTLRTFSWTRASSDVAGSGKSFQFRDVANTIPPWTYGRLDASVRRYGRTMSQSGVRQPWAHLLEGYEKYFYLRGPLLAVIVLVGAGGVVARWRRLGGVVLLPWAVGALLIILPPATAGFSYRYALTAVPAVCLAAGLSLTEGAWAPLLARMRKNKASDT